MTHQILKPLVALEDQPGMPEAIGSALRAGLGKVCSVCGLEQMGHGPESKWLGHEPHPWQGVPATEEMLANASALTTLAYRSRA